MGAVKNVNIAAAHTDLLDLHQDLIRSWLWYGNLMKGDLFRFGH